MELSPYIEMGLHDLIQDLTCKAVAVRILGRSIGWVDPLGVYHQDEWDPERDEITITFPPAGEDERPGPLS